MNNAPPLQRAVLWALGWIERYRFFKFGIVGASGTVVNLAVLYVGHEYIFNVIESSYKRPYFSLALAIFLATINNFTWNRLWTWRDRVKELEADVAMQPVGLRVLSMEFGQYATVAIPGIVTQFALTMLLSGSMYYLIANLLSIVVFSVISFLANDRWTFRRR
ncbi:MAG: GtrA family protein [Burkholderiales bacterium]|nr:GtrA family protein [Burkholderiales bacterium]